MKQKTKTSRKQKTVMVVGALAVAGGAVIAAAGTSQASGTDRGLPSAVSSVSTRLSHLLPGLDDRRAEAYGEYGAGRRIPRA
ncbi:hypothetical protein [Streptomyces anandii]|uniref:hypothetical protein n=1 Tax=Streptomyces anandii TaxID=285454 RepID=UPI00167AADB0|nr:hypothetical protein [Streptomyces anandii]GGY10275.1 hypothetical protein GCM10010510_65390 [Streptomyces anandii JCM 4720]